MQILLRIFTRKKAMTTPGYEWLEKYAVTDCKTLDEFMNRYYKHSRYRGQGEEHAHNLFQSHRKDLLELGVDWISNHDSNTGEIVAFFPPKETGMEDK